MRGERGDRKGREERQRVRAEKVFIFKVSFLVVLLLS